VFRSGAFTLHVGDPRGYDCRVGALVERVTVLVETPVAPGERGARRLTGS
jgi:hypothetical protein